MASGNGYADQLPMSVNGGNAFNLLIDIVGVADADISGSTTQAGLEAAIVSRVAGLHADQQPFATRANKMIDLLFAIGDFPANPSTISPATAAGALAQTAASSSKHGGPLIV
jgi:outer membrane receptor for ferric coprogen and ferric-rhodotorulic acid